MEAHLKSVLYLCRASFLKKWRRNMAGNSKQESHCFMHILVYIDENLFLRVGRPNCWYALLLMYL